MPFRYAEFMTQLMAPKPYPAQAVFTAPRITALRKPVEDCTVGVFTSCGAQLKDDQPLAETNDLTYRLLHRDTPLKELKVSHRTPSRKWALEDLNVAYPRDRLIELETEGVFKKLAPNAVSMVGSITLYTELLTEVVPRIKEEFDRQDVDLALILPF